MPNILTSSIREMSLVKCIVCQNIWDATRHPTCPTCQAKAWLSNPNLVQPKHDPALLGKPWNSFRSVLPNEFSASANVYIDHVASAGSAFQSIHHQDYFVFAILPANLPAGSAVPKGSVMPTTAQDGLQIVQAYHPSAHIHAEDLSQLQHRISLGHYAPLQTCNELGCNNLRYPPTDKCALHSKPPLAFGSPK